MTAPAGPGGSPGSAWAGTSLYVHVPFCARACPYCDFDFEVGRRPDVAGWMAGLRAHAEASVPAERPSLRTVYLGGGTPSLLTPAQLRELVAWIRERFDCTAVQEWTIELNPEHVDAARLEAIASVGIDRVSIGTQSAQPRGLRMLGRAHAPEAGLAAVRDAVALGLRTSADVIVGWPTQTPDELRADLDAFVATGAGHVSIYALTIEPGTPWESLHRRGTRALPDPDRQAELLVRVDAELTAAGLEHYETASFARPGQRSIHNHGYWSWRDVIGLGPSAASVTHGPGGVLRRTAPRGLAAWRADPRAGTDDALGPVAAAAEGLWLGLRRSEGVAVADLQARFGAVDAAWMRARAERQVRRGNLHWEGDTLRLSPGRWLWHDEVGVDLLAGPDEARGTAGLGAGDARSGDRR